MLEHKFLPQKFMKLHNSIHYTYDFPSFLLFYCRPHHKDNGKTHCFGNSDHIGLQKRRPMHKRGVADEITNWCNIFVDFVVYFLKL